MDQVLRGAVEARFETVQDHPKIGPRRYRVAEGLRVHFRRDYAMSYLATDTEAMVVRVVHGACNVRVLCVSSKSDSAARRRVD